MVIGVGTDLVAIARIDKLIARFGGRFIERIFTTSEQAMAKTKRRQNRFYAMGFAAKEAAWKALSPPRHSGIGWHDFEVLRHENGGPELILHGKAADLLNEKVDGAWASHLSLSDDKGIALAFVVLSAR